MATLSEKQMLHEHLPYRMRHLDGLCWACEQILSGGRDEQLVLSVGSTRPLHFTSSKHLTNALVEVGLLYCRVLLGFLGLRLQRTIEVLQEVKTPGKDDEFSVVKIGLQPLSLSALQKAPIDTPSRILEACRRTLIAANKGVAHFTDHDRGRSQTEDEQLCARTILWHIENHVYRSKGIEVPPYKVWTSA